MPVERINAPSLKQTTLPAPRSSSSIYEEAAVSIDISAATRLRAAGGLPFFADRSGALAFAEDIQSETLANVERSRKGDEAAGAPDPQGDLGAPPDPLQRIQMEQSRKAQQFERIQPSRALEEQRAKSDAANIRKSEEQRSKEIMDSRSYERVTDEGTRKKLSEERLKQADRPEEAMQREAALKSALAARVDEPRPVPDTRPATAEPARPAPVSRIEPARTRTEQVPEPRTAPEPPAAPAQNQAGQAPTARIQDTGTGS